MQSAPRLSSFFARVMLCVFCISAITSYGSAESQLPDVESAILRAKELGSSMDLKRVEEALSRLEQKKRSDQPKEAEQNQNSDESSSFSTKLDTAKQQGLNERFVVAILELAREYPNALTDPQIKNLVDVATVEVQGFFRAYNEEYRTERTRNDLRKIAVQLRIYQSDNGSLPTREQGIGALVNNPTGVPTPNNWRQLLQRIPLDPWGEPYVYRPDGNEFQIASKGRDREEGNEDDLVFNSSSQE